MEGFHDAAPAVVGLVPARDGVVLLLLDVDEFDAVADEPVEEVAAGVVEVELGPLGVGLVAIGGEDVAERELGGVVDAATALKRRAGDATAAAADDGRAAELGQLVEGHEGGARGLRFQRGGGAYRARADDHDVGFMYRSLARRLVRHCASPSLVCSPRGGGQNGLRIAQAVMDSPPPGGVTTPPAPFTS